MDIFKAILAILKVLYVISKYWPLYTFMEKSGMKTPMK